jgi:putative chitinase
MISLKHMQKVFGPHITEDLLVDLLQTMSEYDIETDEQVAQFLAQIGHESNGFRARKENLNYSVQGLVNTFGKYFNATTAPAYARQPQKIANKVYANRMGNGSEASGDGWKYAGKGFIQLTGKDNVSRYAKYKKISIEECVAYLDTQEGACDSAGWFWTDKKLNDIANDCRAVTKKINGGYIGLPEREKHYEELLELISEGD